jgi:thiol:disulfide interchange protein DsbC
MRMPARATILALISLSIPALAAEPAVDPLAASIRKTLTSRFPEVPVLDVRATPMPGIYEVYNGDNIAYTDSKGDYLLLGSLLDTRTKANLTAESMDARQSIDFSSLPLDKAIVIVKGNGLRKLAVFTDPDCPFCRKVEAELARLNDVTLYMFLYPVEELHPGATQKAKQLWCAPDKAKAWLAWMSVESRLPDNDGKCAGGVVDPLQALGMKLQVSSTPTLFTENGRRISGVASADQMEKLLSSTKP